MIQCSRTGTAITLKNWNTKMNSKFNELRRFWFAGFFILLAIPGLTFAQVPAAVEGPIVSVILDGLGGADVNVMGINVYVPATVFASGLAVTPTATLSNPADLIGASLDGRTQAGFIGGTAIINGMSSLTGGFVADDFFVEASETVLIGTVTGINAMGTGANPCDIYVEGVLLTFSDDYRMPFDKSINGSGFDVLPCTVVAGNSVAGEGYYGPADGEFHIFLLESDDATVAGTGGITTITRARCTNGRRIEVRGSSTLPSGTVKLWDADAPAEQPRALGEAALQFDALTGTSIYRVRENIGSCPQNVRAESWDANGSTTADSYAIAPVD
jgi:hypothetical protein